MKPKFYWYSAKSKCITLAGVLLLCTLANSQALEPSKQDSQLETYDFHIKKYKSNRTTGRILLITGSVSFVAGMVINLADVDNTIIEMAITGESEGTAGTDLGSGLMIGGAVAALASIPFYIKAKEHDKKANLLLGTTQSAFGDTKVNIPKNVGISVIIPIN